MQQLPGSQCRIQLGIKGWAAIAIGLTAFIAVATVLAIGFFFVVLPMVILAPLIYWLMPKQRVFFVGSPGASKPMNDANDSTPGPIIDGTYREIDTNAP